MTEWIGHAYRAIRRLSTKADETLAEAGQTCERVPAASLPALLASGKIEAVVAPSTAGDDNVLPNVSDQNGAV